MNDRWADNPFFVLELPVTATRAEIERAGQKWLGMLELDLSRARIYTTPVGARARTPELVRAAMAELRDPARRLAHELWCLGEGGVSAHEDVEREPEPERVTETAEAFDALTILEWSPR